MGFNNRLLLYLETSTRGISLAKEHVSSRCGFGVDTNFTTSIEKSLMLLHRVSISFSISAKNPNSQTP